MENGETYVFFISLNIRSLLVLRDLRSGSAAIQIQGKLLHELT